jgi:hypothetical protein
VESLVVRVILGTIAAGILIGWLIDRRKSARFLTISEESCRRAGALRPVASADSWTAYFWRGHAYGSSGGSHSGLYILRHDDIADAEPSPYDEGTGWGRWTGEGS